jgi:16S rRNA (adenine1518-N6/adenine1519-N6)-dimethyltransferase
VKRPLVKSQGAPAPAGLQQHDLSSAWARRIVAEARVLPTDTVLEVGPGKGELTAAMVANGVRVTTVETDPARCTALKARFPDGQVTVIQGDILAAHPRFSGAWRVVANPPFSLTAALVRGWLLGLCPGDPPAALDLVLQREAIHKFGGAPANESRTSVLVRLAGTPRMASELPRDATTPPSRVDLAVWSFRRDGRVNVADLRLVDELLETAFAGAHQVGDALRGLASSVQVKRQGAENGWSPTAHPRTLAPEAWLSLARLLKLCGKLGR